MKQEFDKVVSEAAEGVKSRDEAIKKREELIKKRDMLLKEKKKENERLKKLINENETTREGLNAAQSQLKTQLEEIRKESKMGEEILLN